MKATLSASALAVAAVLLISCGSPEPMVVSDVKTRTDTSSADQTTAPELVSESAPAAPWYTARLEALGFYVFPAPESVPPIMIKTLAGASFSNDALSGKVVLLNFWATWCPPCRLEMPSIQVLYRKTRDVAFDIMAVSVAETRATVTDFLKNNPSYTYPMYLDESGAASAPFAGRGIPTTFLLDKQGNAIAGLIGSRMYDGPEVIGIIRELAERLP
ncbi:MAG: TlpA family protein disulfide reductase [Spirochaetales bacterium]|nr:MAG: TlpA family protein disulfide reductase [Spirochaetales bacterium]